MFSISRSTASISIRLLLLFSVSSGTASISIEMVFSVSSHSGHLHLNKVVADRVSPFKWCSLLAIVQRSSISIFSVSNSTVNTCGTQSQELCALLMVVKSEVALGNDF